MRGCRTEGILLPVIPKDRSYQPCLDEKLDSSQCLCQVSHRDVLATDDAVEVQKRLEVADVMSTTLAKHVSDLNNLPVFQESPPKPSKASGDLRQTTGEDDFIKEGRYYFMDAVVRVTLETWLFARRPCRLCPGLQ